MRITHVNIGWRGLENILNQMIDAINSNEPLEGSGIRITTHSPYSGALIETANSASGSPPPDSGQSAGGGGQMSGGQWTSIVAFDPNGNPVTLNVYSLQGILPGGSSAIQWGPVSQIDPTTCESSTVTVLKPG